MQAERAEIKKHLKSVYGAKDVFRGKDATQSPFIDVRFEQLWQAKAFLRSAPKDDMKPKFLAENFVKAEPLWDDKALCGPEPDPKTHFAQVQHCTDASGRRCLESSDDDLDDLVAPSDPRDHSSEGAYFRSYSKTMIHQVMLMDRVRTEAYRDAMQASRHLIEGKIV